MDCALEVGLRVPNCLMSWIGVPISVEWARSERIRGSSRPAKSLVLIFLRAGLRGRRVPEVPYLVKTSRFRTLSARSRRVRGGRSKATWQIRSKGSRILTDFLGELIQRQHALGWASSSRRACLRSAARHRVRNESRLDKSLSQSLLGEVPQALGDELPVIIQVFDALGEDDCWPAPRPR